MRLLLLPLFLFMACSNSSSSDEQELVLHEQTDAKGRLKKKVVTGRIAGEDIYLTITEYDTLGRPQTEYGIKPYANKFKVTYIYDSMDRITELTDYVFFSDSLNLIDNSQNLYSLQDTSIDFNRYIQLKTTLHYDYLNNLVTERQYHVVFDSLNEGKFIIGLDTTYQPVF
jgi:hypothetical protein